MIKNFFEREGDTLEKDQKKFDEFVKIFSQVVKNASKFDYNSCEVLRGTMGLLKSNSMFWQKYGEKALLQVRLQLFEG